MKKMNGRRLSAPMTVLVAGLLLVGSATGGAVAAGLINGSRLVNNTVTSAKIKDHTLKAADISRARWHAMTLGSDWSSAGSDQYGPAPRYTKDALGFVHLEGALGTSAASPGAVATLPAAFRPAHGAWLVAGSTTGFFDPRLVNVWVGPDGVIQMYGASDADFGFVSLAGLTYYAG